MVMTCWFVWMVLKRKLEAGGFMTFIREVLHYCSFSYVPFAILMVLELWSFWNMQYSSSHYFCLLFESMYLLLVASWGLLTVPQRHLGEKADASSFLFRLAVEAPAYNKWLLVVVPCYFPSSCCSCDESFRLYPFDYQTWSSHIRKGIGKPLSVKYLL